MHAIVTGATGLFGRHLVAQLVAEGWSVTALVRETSDRTALESLGVNFRVCDLATTDPDPAWFRGADVVFHASAAVTEWAPWSYFHANTIRATERVCNAMIDAGCRRLVHISSVAVYGKPATTEPVHEDYAAGPPGRWNYYRRSKLEAERIVWQRQQSSTLQVTVLRPAMMYGPADRGLLGRVIPLLRQRKAVFVGDPQVTIPLIHVRDVARISVIAVTSLRAIGEAFNVVSDERISQETFFNTIASLVGAPAVRRRVPYRVAYTAGFAAELWGHLLRSDLAPPVTRYRVFLIGHQREYATDKARNTLGWQPQVKFQDGVREAVRWHLEHEHA